jgi:hypothetical protein
MKALFLLLILVVQNDDSISPDGKFNITVIGKEIGDSNIELEYFLVDQSTKDSLLLTRTIIHDLLPPVYFWTKDSKNIVFEDKQEGEYSKIKVMILETKEIILELDGFINCKSSSKNNYSDLTNNLVFFFKRNEGRKCELYLLDINSKASRHLTSFENWDAYETPKIIDFDKSTNELSIVTQNKDYQTETIMVKL